MNRAADTLEKALMLAAEDGKADALRAALVDLREDGSLLVACWLMGMQRIVGATWRA